MENFEIAHEQNERKEVIQELSKLLAFQNLNETEVLSFSLPPYK